MRSGTESPNAAILAECTVEGELPLAWNAILAARAQERMRIRKADKMRWFALLAGAGLPRGLSGVELEITAWGGCRRDPDGLFVKPLIDALVALGVLPDDDQRHVRAVRLAYRQEKGRLGTRVRVLQTILR